MDATQPVIRTQKQQSFRYLAGRSGRLLGLALWTSLVTGLAAPAIGAGFRAETLEGGLHLVYSERRGSGLVALAVIVQAGAAWEDETTNGAAHFLEHLLFNGTFSRTQEELYSDIDLLGAYANATTRRDHVVYLMVCAAEDLDRGMELLTDMLLHSTLLPDKFEKERGIILEEISKDRANPEYLVERRIDAAYGQGSSYARPVLGTGDSIEAMDRQAVLDYYRRFYVPANMTLLVAGDVTWEAAREVATWHLTAAPAEQQRAAVPRRPALRSQVAMLAEPADHTALVVRMAVMPPDDPDLPALYLLDGLLNGDNGRLQTAFRDDSELELHSVGAQVHLEAGQCLLELRAQFASDISARAVAGRLFETLDELAATPPTARELAAVRTSRVVHEALQHDQIHYMAFMLAPQILHAPLWMMSGEQDVYDSVAGSDIQRLVSRIRSDRTPAEMVVVGPNVAGRTIQRDPRQWAQGMAWTDSTAGQAARRSQAQVPGLETDPWDALSHDPEPQRATGTAAPRRLELPNGLTLLLQSNPDSRVFAAHLAVRGRSYREPEGKAGIADLVHRMLPLGAGDWSREELGQLLDRAGIQLKVTDSPWIPYDDYYTTQDHSFVRLETVDRFYREALVLFAAMVGRPSMDVTDFAEVAGDAKRAATRREDSARDRSRRLLRELQWLGSPGAREPLGTIESLDSITHEEARDFHATYFSPENLILTIVSGIEPSVVYEAVRETFGRLGPASGTDGTLGNLLVTGTQPREVASPPPTAEPDTRVENTGTEQAYIRLGVVHEVPEAEMAALEVTVGLLADRMAFELRERQGLAYSIGAGMQRFPDRALVTAWMGTRSENVENALAGMTDFMQGFAGETISSQAIHKIVKSRIGRMRMRQVARIGQAYIMTMELLHGKQIGATRRELDSQLQVGPEDVRRVAGKYLTDAPLVRVVVR